eukprot:1368399-Amorphochlora_amoeboformis.AAC.2
MASSGSTRSSGRVGSLISAARESFSDEFDALAFAVHASFLAKGYKCVKLAETDQETGKESPSRLPQPINAFSQTTNHTCSHGSGIIRPYDPKSHYAGVFSVWEITEQ